MKTVGYCILAVFLLLSALSIALRTSWGVKMMSSFLVEKLEKGDLQLTLGKVEGALPNALKISEITLQKEGLFIEAKEVTLHLSLLKLLKKELAFSELQAQSCRIESKGYGGERLPFKVSIRHFSIGVLEAFNFSEENVEGALKWGKSIELKLKTALFSLQALVRKENLQLRLEGMWKNTPLYPSWEADLSFLLFAKGPLKAWVEGAPGVEGHLSGTLALQKGELTEKKAPFLYETIEFHSPFVRGKEKLWHFPHLELQSPSFQGKIALDLTEQGALEEANFQLHAKKEIPLFDKSAKPYIEGTCKAALHTLQCKSHWEIPSFDLLSAITVDVEALFDEFGVAGNFTSRATLFSENFTIASPFMKKKSEPLFLDGYKIESSFLSSSGELALKEGLWDGFTDISSLNLSFFPTYSLLGNATGRIDWKYVEEEQIASFDLRLDNAYWKNVFAEEGFIRGEIFNPWKNPYGTLDLFLENSRWKNLSLDTLELQFSLFEQKTPFFLSMEGSYNFPFFLEVRGEESFKDNTLRLEIANIEGSYKELPLFLEEKCIFEYGPNLLRASEFSLLLGESALRGSFDREKKALALETQNFPLELLVLDPLEISLEGSLDLDLVWDKAFTLDLKNVQVLSFTEDSVLRANGHFTGTMEGKRIEIEGDLNKGNAPMLHLALDLPKDFSQEKPISGALFFDGKIEHFLDFFNLSSHKVTGNTYADLHLSGTLQHPQLEGALEIDEGTYQNYYTGVYLKDLFATFVGTGPSLVLQKLRAKDSAHKGFFEAMGKISLLPQRDFPFTLHASFSRLNCVQLYLIQAEASGKVSIEGDLKGAHMVGDVDVLETDLSIPEKIPRPLPDLQVVYRNASAPPIVEPPKALPPYPLTLDLDVRAPSGIFISGRGLDSEWKGNFHLTGTFQALETKGNLELIEGKFHLSNKVFSLRSGKLSFTGEENGMPILAIEAMTKVKEIEIIAKLKGPLNNPQLSLFSSPPLPLSSVLAYLLFGEDVSDINSFQALELVNSLTSLIGESPSILEQSKNALGIDRIRLVSIPSGDEEETVAVEVGKYVADGVLVTFSQGASDASGNVGVEVELSHGFSFQIETQQSQEQGKFSLKWSWNY